MNNFDFKKEYIRGMFVDLDDRNIEENKLIELVKWVDKNKLSISDTWEFISSDLFDDFDTWNQLHYYKNKELYKDINNKNNLDKVETLSSGAIILMKGGE